MAEEVIFDGSVPENGSEESPSDSHVIDSKLTESVHFILSLTYLLTSLITLMIDNSHHNSHNNNYNNNLITLSFR